MKKVIVFVAMLLIATVSHAQVAKIVGDWITVDDATGAEYSVVHIYKATNGKYYGKIAQMLVAGTEDEVCVKCKGEDKNKPILGMIIIRDMEEKDGMLKGGSVLDPESGNIYHGTISFDASTGKLKLRGSIDRAGILGRSQYWKRKQ